MSVTITTDLTKKLFGGDIYETGCVTPFKHAWLQRPRCKPALQSQGEAQDSSSHASGQLGCRERLCAWGTLLCVIWFLCLALLESGLGLSGWVWWARQRRGLCMSTGATAIWFRVLEHRNHPHSEASLSIQVSVLHHSLSLTMLCLHFMDVLSAG